MATSPTSTEGRLDIYAGRLRMAIAAYHLDDNPLAEALTGSTKEESLEKIERDAAPKRGQDVVDALAWSIARKARGKALEKAPLEKIRQVSAKGLTYEALRTNKRTPREAETLAKGLEKVNAISKVLAGEVRREAGVKSKRPSFGVMALVGLGFLAILAGSVIAWIAPFGIW